MLEPSPGMYAIAIEVLHETQVQIHSCGAEDLPPADAYELVLSHLCLQVVSDLGPFVRSIAAHLNRECGTFVLTIPHPAFYNDYKRFIPDSSFHYMRDQEQTIEFAISLDPARKITGVPYHHRPLMRYVNALGDAGLCITRMDEVFPDQKIQALYGGSWEAPRYVSLIGGHRVTQRAT
jgi:hypothetical protein